MADNKMTRKDVLAAILCEDWDTLKTDEARTVAEKMLNSIKKAADKPKTGKTSARIQNEAYARELVGKMPSEPFTAKWISENVRFVGSPQRAVHVARIAEEWGALTTVSVKNRTYYVANEDYTPAEQ